MESIIKILLVLSVSLLLGYSGKHENIKYANDSAVSASSKLLRARSSDNLEKQFKASLINRYGKFDAVFRSEFFLASNGNTALVASPGTFSSTTLQEAGVDESDRLKTDGKHIYVSTIASSSIKVFKSQNGGASLVGQLPIPTHNDSAVLSSLYLNADKQQIIALADNKRLGEDSTWFSSDDWDKKVTELFNIDVSSPTTPKVRSKLRLDGQLISSRRIGDTLYLATRHQANIPQLHNHPGDSLEALYNRTLIENTSMDELLPKYQTNGEQRAIFKAEDCFYTGRKPSHYSQHSIISLLAIDLNEDQLKPQGQCFIGDAETVYASTKAIYLATTQYQYTDKFSDVIYEGSPTTEIHKFALDGSQTDYVGSASIDGHLGWQQSQKSFRMSEDKGFLRVLSYVGETADSIESPARLHILKDNINDATLDIIATLPNETRTAPLGKKGEQIYATRFIGERGYLVTFRATDPLYILDISNPYDPFIMSALEIDGYSDLLIPVSENFLLGIGKDAIAAATEEDDFNQFRGAWQQGVKLSLIDIRDPYAPIEKQKIIFGRRGTESAASLSHHALTTLLRGNHLQINLPVSLHEAEIRYGDDARHPSDYFGWTQDTLQRLTIDTNSGEIEILKPIIATFDNIPADAKYYFDTDWQHDRSVIIGDDTYYLKRDKVFTSAD